MLSDTPTEGDIVVEFSGLENIQQAVIIQKIATVKGLIRLLDIQDRIGTLNSYRGPIRYENFNETYTPMSQRQSNTSQIWPRQTSHSKIKIHTLPSALVEMRLLYFINKHLPSKNLQAELLKKFQFLVHIDSLKNKININCVKIRKKFF